MDLAEKLIVLRRKRHLTQKDVAQAIGVTRQTYSNYEVGDHAPRSRKTYQALADFFEVPFDYLCTPKEEFLYQASRSYGRKGLQEARDLVENFAGLFAGGSLSEKDRDAIFRDIEKIYWFTKTKERTASGEADRK